MACRRFMIVVYSSLPDVAISARRCSADGVRLRPPARGGRLALGGRSVRAPGRAAADRGHDGRSLSGKIMAFAGPPPDPQRAVTAVSAWSALHAAVPAARRTV